ncbi:hypothetical protein SDRG_01542 [Saprolegnia diclina VS20]|uniref:Ras-GAP domain-containing protein n=1 Tax=Saprolegnia diclina (strain VS20) TaxID=1156394 RepID=T0R3P5_SAPDV|nr:hypothetical protein SDRG_01542 [Saprolegnia diclina VS20]EQC41581.1 hypothetical protein SDRG_01542 [Saprolegnia diclina VS20]|eukprot:XP_008605295.1 hypothetical protein SDRG_01542 [Saprolegnia diclina VS20]
MTTRMTTATTTTQLCMTELPSFETFARVVEIELDRVRGEEEQFLRSSTGLSSTMKDLGHTYGRKYFRFLLGDAVAALGGLHRDQVLALAKDVVHRMVSSLDDHAPYRLRLSCAYILDEFHAAFPQSVRGSTIVVGGSIVLRIVCPAIIKPELIGLPPHAATALPNAILLAKLLQHSMRGTEFDMASDDLYFAKDFVAETKELFAGYLAAFPSTKKTGPIDVDCDDELLDTMVLTVDTRPTRRASTPALESSPSPKRKFSFRKLFRKESSSSAPSPRKSHECRHCGRAL